MLNEATVIIHECPQCGAPAQINSNICHYCKAEFLIKSLNSLRGLDKNGIDKYISSYKKVSVADSNNKEINAAMGMCYLRLGLYDFAIKFFQKAIEDMIENSEVYFYAAVCMLKGKKAFLTPIAEIKRAEDYINAALALENKGLYYYFLAYLKYDFYERKQLNSLPTYLDILILAKENGVSKSDIQFLFELLKVSQPDFHNFKMNYTPL